MLQDVAAEHPVAGIVGDEGNLDALARGEQDRTGPAATEATSRDGALAWGPGANGSCGRLRTRDPRRAGAVRGKWLRLGKVVQDRAGQHVQPRPDPHRPPLDPDAPRSGGRPRRRAASPSPPVPRGRDGRSGAPHYPPPAADSLRGWPGSRTRSAAPGRRKTGRCHRPGRQARRNRCASPDGGRSPSRNRRRACAAESDRSATSPASAVIARQALP